MEMCIECNKEYNPEEVNIPSPIPDLMCAACGNVLTQQEVENLGNNPNTQTLENA